MQNDFYMYVMFLMCSTTLYPPWNDQRIHSTEWIYSPYQGFMFCFAFFRCCYLTSSLNIILWNGDGMRWPWKGGDWMSVLNKNKHRFWWPSKPWGEVLRKVFSQVFSYPSTVCDNDRETMIDDKRTKLSTEANKLLFMYQ